jgi:ABC-type taurine transport system substrate-binding protein
MLTTPFTISELLIDAPLAYFSGTGTPIVYDGNVPSVVYHAPAGKGKAVFVADKMVAAADADYRANPNDYGPGTAKAKAIARAVSGQEDQVGGVLALYGYPTLEEQASATWLGGGVATALKATSEFLRDQGKIDEVLDSYDGASNPTFVKMVLDGKC